MSVFTQGELSRRGFTAAASAALGLSLTGCSGGVVSGTRLKTISMEGFSSKMKLFSIPYLFQDSDHVWRVLNSEVGTSLLDSLRDVRLQGLGYYDAGSRSFYMTDAPIRTPADLRGKKVRVLPSRTSIEMVEALGGAATPISWGELYTALQQGIVDGAENNPPSLGGGGDRSADRSG